MRNIYIVMVAVCATISIVSLDNLAGFTGWLSAALAYGLAAMER